MSIRDRLRLAFHRPETVSEEEPPPVHLEPELEFVAYAEDCRLFGHIRLDASRLTDMLNEYTTFELVDVAMEALTDGRIVELQSMVVAREELIAVQATGPRGVRERRQRTRPHPVAVQSSAYHIRGHLHAVPTADPFATLRRRPEMVPLTEGSITYPVAGQSILRRTDTIIINRSLIDWIVPATDEEIRFPELPAATGVLVKDFTGAIYEIGRRNSFADEPEPEPLAPAALAPAGSGAPVATQRSAAADESAVGGPEELPATKARRARRSRGGALRKAG